VLATGTGFETLLAADWVIYGFYLAAIGWSIYSAVRGPDQQQIDTTGPRVEDNKLTVSTLGTPRPICYGTVRLSGNIIWCGDLEEEVITEEIESSGGKGGGGGISATNTSYLYYRSLAIAFAEGGANCRLIKLYASGKLVWDIEGTSKVEVSGVHLTWHSGTDSQAVDSLIEADVGSANCPAYRGTCYAVLDRFPLVDFGNGMPNFTAIITWEFTATEPVTVLGDDVQHWYGAWHQRDDALFMVGPTSGSAPMELSRFDLASDTRTHNINLTTTLGTNPGTIGVLPLSQLVAVFATDDFGVFEPNTLELLAEESHTSGLNAIGNANGAFFSKPTEGADYALCPGVNSRIVAYRVVGDPGGPVITKVLDISTQALTLPAGYLVTQTFAYDAVADRDGNTWIVGKVQETAITDAEPTIWKFAPSIEDEIREADWFQPTHVDFPADMSLENVGYDSATHSLLILGTSSGTSTLFRWDIETESVLWVQEGSDYTTNFVATADASRQMFKHPYGSTIFLACVSTQRFVREFRILDGEMLREYELTDWFPCAGTQACLYHWPTHSVTANNSSTTDYVLNRAWLDRGTSDLTSLDAVVSDICVRAGLSTGDINVTDLTSEDVRGFRITRRTSARTAIETLTKGYFFDAVESDFKLKFLRRAGSRDTGETIPEDDLGVRIETPGNVFIEEERVQDEEIPVQYDMRFINPNIDYQEDSAIAQRILSPIMHVTSQSEQAADLPIVFTATEARRVAERWLYTAWTERTGLKFSLGPKWLRADPTDIFEIVANSVTRDVRMLGVRVGESFDLEVEAAVVDQESYAVTDYDGATIDFTPQEIGVVSGTYMIVLDIPLLVDSHDGNGLTIPIYLSTRSIAASGWRGGVALKSYDLNSWTQLALFTSDTAYGTTTTTLGDWTTPTIDRTSTVQVQLAHGGLSLSSITEDQMLRGGNAAMIGTELVSFQNATDQGGNVWELDTFIRGRKGTEWATGGHSTGERFVFLSVGSVRLHQAPLTDLNIYRYYRGVSLGASLTSGHMVSLATTGVSLMPLSPSYIAGVRDSGASKLHVHWHRRTRIIGELDWTNSSELPVGENPEVYEVDLLHKTTGAVVETYTTTGQGSRQKDGDVTFSLPGGGITRASSGGIDEDDYVAGRLVRVIGARESANNGTYLIATKTSSQVNMENANGVADVDHGASPDDDKVLDEICEQVAIPAADLDTAGYTGITDDVDVVVYQISAVVGRGYGTSATV
jgi:hypothetical protein